MSAQEANERHGRSLVRQICSCTYEYIKSAKNGLVLPRERVEVFDTVQLLLRFALE